MKTALYRHFDADHQLLYVGISLSAVARLAAHKQTAHWFTDIARVEVQWLDSREDALAAEAAAITAENPRWNLQRPAAAQSQTSDTAAGEVWPSEIRYEGFQILHLRSGRRDGNYFDEDQAREMFDWWCAEYPSERFIFVVAQGPAQPALRPYDADQWRSS